MNNQSQKSNKQQSTNPESVSDKEDKYQQTGGKNKGGTVGGAHGKEQEAWSGHNKTGGQGTLGNTMDQKEGNP